MTTAVILDAGALAAVSRQPRRAGRWFEWAEQERHRVFTSAAAVAQAWPGSLHQTGLGRLLKGVSAVSLDMPAARAVGGLLHATGGSDVAQAHIALLAQPDDHVITASPLDMARLLAAVDVRARIVAI